MEGNINFYYIGELIGSLIAGLLMTFLLTRFSIFLFSKKLNKKTASIITFFFISTVMISIDSVSSEDGFGGGFIVYESCLIFWLMRDLNKSNNNNT